MKGAITGSNWKMASPAKRVAPPIPVRTSEIDHRFVRLRKKTGSQACPLTFGGFPAKCLMLPIYATVDATMKKRMLAQESQNGYVSVRTQTQSSIDNCDQASDQNADGKR
jgi:hypothetical protein